MCSLHKFNDIEEIGLLSSGLSDWYKSNCRDLPWRRLLDQDDRQAAAYGVLVSEIMSQQTRIATVVQYYQRWMERWPTVGALANAEEDEVRAQWAGLGYYRRARNLLMAARAVMEKHEGVIPDSVEGLLSLPGVGQYTAGAIASIAFEKPAPLVDGNVVRVFSRLRAIGIDTRPIKSAKVFWSLADDVMNHRSDNVNPGTLNQALMELGSEICTKSSPKCSQCPVVRQCQAYNIDSYPGTGSGAVSDCSLCLPRSSGTQNDGLTSGSPAPPAAAGSLVHMFPVKSPKAKPKPMTTVVVIVENETTGELLLRQRPKSGLLGSMWEFIQLDGSGTSTRSATSPAASASAVSTASGEQSSSSGGSVAVASIATTSNEVLPSAADVFHTFFEPTNERLLFHSLGTAHHLFTHISQSLLVHHCKLREPMPALRTDEYQLRWVSRADLKNEAVTKSMWKCLSLLDDSLCEGNEKKKSKKK